MSKREQILKYYFFNCNYFKNNDGQIKNSSNIFGGQKYVEVKMQANNKTKDKKKNEYGIYAKVPILNTQWYGTLLKGRLRRIYIYIYMYVERERENPRANT